MMICDNTKIHFLACLSAALVSAVPCTVCAQEADAAGDAAAAPAENQMDPELKNEIAYVEALIQYGLPDFAEPVIAATKAKWPESEAMFFAIEVRGMLLLGKTEEAEAKIAALPDRTGAKYWAARLEVANNHFQNHRNAECAKIYGEFFQKNQKPSKDLIPFVRNAYYQWGYLLVLDKRFADAADTYAKLMGMLDYQNNDEDKSLWCGVACEGAELYLRVAKDTADKKKRDAFLGKAKGIVKQLLWQMDNPVVFGRAIAMKANIELLGGSVKKAQETIDDYMDQLKDLHEQLEARDPDGREGFLRQSPMPLCRFMLAEMLWNEAKEEAKKPKRDDERIKSLLFGEKGRNGKRNGSGAFNHALNVFVRFPMSPWASQAGDMSKEIEAFVKKEYNVEVKANITPEQEAKVREMQFKIGNDKLAEKDYQGAIDEYFTALGNFPEGRESITAIENLIKAYQSLILRTKNPAEKDALRIYADAVEGYLAERFGGASDKVVMISAGDATLRVASKEKAMGNIAGADRLYKSFLSNYRRHSAAATMALSMANEAKESGKYRDAIELFGIVDKFYRSSPFYASALSNLAACYDKIGDRASSMKTLERYVEVEKNELRKMQTKLNLAKYYQMDGLEIITAAQTNETKEVIDRELARGSVQIIQGIKRFRDFAKEAGAKLSDPAVSAKDKDSYSKLREAALYMAGDCWSRLTKPEDKVDGFRRNAVKCLEDYVTAYPKGEWAKRTYVKLGTIYTILNEVEKCKDALARLRKEFPDSDEAKKAMPRLARNLIEYSLTIPDEAKKEALKRESTDIYAEMIRSDSSDYQPYDFVRAGESLIDAKSWSLADEAFDKAILKAGTNHVNTVARARLGKAKSLMAQKNWNEAREYLDQFMADEKMSKLGICTNACDMIVQCATAQGRQERDETIRRKHYGAAIGAVKRLRNYWRNEPVWKQDTVDLMSADVRISQVEAEMAMGLEEEAAKTRGTAATTLQTFLQTRAPTAEHTIDQYSAQEADNLEEAYAKLLPLLLKMGKAQANRALKFGTEYLRYFPNGKSRDAVQRCVNEAQALGGRLVEEEESADQGGAGQPAEADGE